MTRKQGILDQWIKNHPDKPELNDKEQIDLLTWEYRQYIELCVFCGEKPLFRYQWLNQKITPKISTQDN